MANFYGGPGEDNDPSGMYDQMYGGGSADEFDSNTKAGQVYMEGGSGDDRLYVVSMNAWGDVYGGDGNDRLDGSSSGNLDRLYGGAGNDVVNGGLEDLGPNLLEGGSGRDFLLGRGGSDTLYGGDGDDSGASIGMWEVAIPVALYGNSGNDWLDGGNGDDVVDGGAGLDTQIGGFGNDTFWIDDPGDVVHEGWGGGIDTARVAGVRQFNYSPSVNDFEFVTIPSGTFSLAPYAEVEIFLADDPSVTTSINLVGSAFANHITGNAGANTLSGLTGDDSLFGLLGTDKLDGGVGNDIVDGGEGNDSLKGGAGKDTLTGGSGRDTFVFNTAPNKTTNVDWIGDFRWQDDTVHLDNATLKKLGSNGKLKSDAFHLGKKAADAEDRVIYDKGTGNLYYDADGTGKIAAIKLAVLQNKATLKLSDLFVI